MQQSITTDTLFYGDNLAIIREYIPDESVDLVYQDPPFNSNRKRIMTLWSGEDHPVGEEMSDSKEKIGNTINQLDLLHRLFIIISATHPLLRASM